MLAAFGAPTGERVAIYVEAVREAGACEPCAGAAARRLTRESKRRPTPADLLDATRSELATAAHRPHVSPRAALPDGDGETWWQTDGARIVRRRWPGLTPAQLETVLSELRRQERCGLVERHEVSIAVAIGWEDERGPTPERTRFLRLLSSDDMGEEGGWKAVS
jgi:hypothetical protein